MTQHTFTRRDGSRFVLTLQVDHDKLAEDMARTVLKRRSTKAKKCGGAVQATIRELP